MTAIIRDTINSGPRDPRTRGPEDLRLLRETEMQLQAKTHGYIIAMPGVCKSAWHKSEDIFSIQDNAA